MKGTQLQICVDVFRLQGWQAWGPSLVDEGDNKPTLLWEWELHTQGSFWMTPISPVCWLLMTSWEGIVNHLCSSYKPKQAQSSTLERLNLDYERKVFYSYNSKWLQAQQMRSSHSEDCSGDDWQPVYFGGKSGHHLNRHRRLQKLSGASTPTTQTLSPPTFAHHQSRACEDCLRASLQRADGGRMTHRNVTHALNGWTSFTGNGLTIEP